MKAQDSNEVVNILKAMNCGMTKLIGETRR